MTATLKSPAKTDIARKVVVSVVSRDMPLEACPIGTRVFIKKDYQNQVDDKALSVLVRHKKTGKWTFIGYVAANPNYTPPEGITNDRLYDLLDSDRPACSGTVVGKMDVVFPFGMVTTALVVEIDLEKLKGHTNRARKE
jgi:hypothetical protein